MHTLAPPDLICPLTSMLILDPAMDEFGEIYEREAIEKYFRESLPPYKSPHTGDDLHTTEVKENRGAKRRIDDLLKKDPSLWRLVYVSKSVLESYRSALALKNKTLLTSLVQEEPRLATLEDYSLLQMIITGQDKYLLKEVFIPALQLRGQKDNIEEINLIVASSNWMDGFLDLTENWTDDQYLEMAKLWSPLTNSLKPNLLSALKVVYGDDDNVHSQKLVIAFRLLIHIMQKNKMNLNSPVDDMKNTLLHLNSQHNNAALVTILLSAGVDCDSKNKDGKTADMIASESNLTEVSDTFKKWKQSGSGSSNGPNLQLQLIQNEVAELRQEVKQVKANIEILLNEKFSMLLQGLASNLHFLVQKNTYNYGLYSTLKGHTSSVYCVIVLQDGKIVSGSSDNTLKVWDITTGQCLKTLEGHTSSVHCVTLLQDGKIVSGSYDKTLKVWDITTGQCLKTLEGHTSTVYCVTLLQDGKIVSGSSDKTLKVWDITTGQCLKTFEGHTSGVNCVTLLQDGKIVSGSYDKTLKVWDITTGQCLKTLEGHTSTVNCVTLLQDGKIVSGSSDTLKVFSTSLEHASNWLTVVNL